MSWFEKIFTSAALMRARVTGRLAPEACKDLRGMSLRVVNKIPSVRTVN